MVVFDLFSKRQKTLRGDVPDVYVYDNLPDTLRTQIVHIWSDTLGEEDQYYRYGSVKDGYKDIVDILCREYGLFRLPPAKEYKERMYLNELVNYLLQEEDVERQLDVIELSFRYIDKIVRNPQFLHGNDACQRVDHAISELNVRFKEHGVGFQFVQGEIVRVDSELLHSEAVKPALRLLNEKSYQGAQQEFLSAYEHYRHGKHKEALNDCLKSFESTMKAICDRHNWEYPSNATAKTLIQICFDNDLIPSFW